MSEARTTLDLAISEKQFQQQVLDLARLRRWRCYHTWLSVRSAPGFPDIIALRGERMLAIELKTMKGRVSRHQRAWLDAFRATGVETYLWRPSDWETITEVLA